MHRSRDSLDRLRPRFRLGCDSKPLSRLRVARLIPRPTPTCSPDPYRMRAGGIDVNAACSCHENPRRLVGRPWQICRRIRIWQHLDVVDRQVRIDRYVTYIHRRCDLSIRIDDKRIRREGHLAEEDANGQPKQTVHSIQESKKPKRYLIAESNLHSVVHNITLRDILDLREALPSPTDLEQPAVVHEKVSLLRISQHVSV